MSQNITLMGASYSAVPEVDLPKTGGGTASFFDVSDTTASASDVASSKYFYTAAGVRTQGTSSGGGGASNIVQGTFTTGATRAGTGTVSLAYTGTGYPIAAFVYIKNGAYNNGTGGNTDWYNSLNRYDCGFYSMVKARTNEAPTYATSGQVNYGTVTAIYKNSTTTATTYTRTSTMTANTYTSSSTNASTSTAMIRFKGNAKTLSWYVGNLTSSTVGLAPEMEYSYIVIYSS